MRDFRRNNIFSFNKIMFFKQDLLIKPISPCPLWLNFSILRFNETYLISGLLTTEFHGGRNKKVMRNI